MHLHPYKLALWCDITQQKRGLCFYNRNVHFKALIESDPLNDGPQTGGATTTPFLVDNRLSMHLFRPRET